MLWKNGLECKKIKTSLNHENDVKVRCHQEDWQVITKIQLQTKYSEPSYYVHMLDLTVKTCLKVDKVIHP